MKRSQMLGDPRLRPRPTWLLLMVVLGAMALGFACSENTSPNAEHPVSKDVTQEPRGQQAVTADEEPKASAVSATETSEEAASASASVPVPDVAYVTFNQNIIEGLGSGGIRLNDPTSVFAYVFTRLPDEVVVYPSENYYYFILQVEGRQIWGNIRLPTGQREDGYLSFGYFEFIEFPTVPPPTSISGSRFYDAEDGVFVEELDPFTYTVEYEGKRVRFRFHELDQTSPAQLSFGTGERFIQRTFDESGYQFYLLFNEQSDYFFWVLNEEEPVPDLLEPFGEELLIGRRSGFAFWVDPLERKVLAGVRQLNIRRNDYFDGPFDQLADNYAHETQIASWMVRAFPGLEGRIDTYGYYTDEERPLRVALSTYYKYAATSHMIEFMKLLPDQTDPYAFISRGGGSPR